MDTLSILGSACHAVEQAIAEGISAQCNKSCCYTFAARLRLVSSLLQHMRDYNMVFPPRYMGHTESVTRLKRIEAMEHLMKRSWDLIRECSRSQSKLYQVLSGPSVVRKFEDITRELLQGVKEVPLVFLAVPGRILSLVQDVRSEFVHAKYVVDVEFRQIGSDLQMLLENKNCTKVDRTKLREMAAELKLVSQELLLKERVRLHKEALSAKAAGRSKDEALVQMAMDLLELFCEDAALQLRHSQLEIPPDYRCPLSLDLMADPVIVASGQTYERAYIEQWLKAGNRSCPKTRQRLVHVCIIPNYAVKALISSWCEANDLPYPSTPELEQKVVVSHFDSLEAKLLKPGMLPTSPTGCSSPDVVVGMMRIFSSDSSSRKGEKKKKGSSELNRNLEQGRQVAEGADQCADGSGKASTLRASEAGGGKRRTPPMLRVEGLKGADSPRSPSSAPSFQSFDLPANEDLSKLRDALPETLPRSGLDDRGALPRSGSSEGSMPSINSDTPRPVTPSDSGHHATKYALSPRSPMSTFSRASEANSDFASDVISDAAVILRRRSASGDAGLASCIAAEMASESMSDPPPREEEIVDVGLLVKALSHGTPEEQKSAAGQARALAKNSPFYRTRLTALGAIAPLVKLLRSSDPTMVEEAVTALLNVSISDGSKGMLVNCGVVDALVDVLQTATETAKENAAAALFSVSTIDEYKITIGQSGAVSPLVDLLIHGTDRGKKDACTALFNLAIYSGNRAKIVRAGAVKVLIRHLSTLLVDKACAVLANLAGIAEGREAIVAEGGLPQLVEILEIGSSKGKENAAATLLPLCLNNPEHSALVLVEGALPPLVALSQSGNTRARDKASQLLKHFRDQRQSGIIRHGSGGSRVGHR